MGGITVKRNWVLASIMGVFLSLTAIVSPAHAGVRIEVPEPCTSLLLGIGFVGLVALRKKFKR
jgi:hypothetical protein